jgi:hypothetical protein
MSKYRLRTMVWASALLAPFALLATVRSQRAEPPIQERLPQIESRRWPERAGYDVDVLIDGYPVQKYYARGRTYIEARRNEEYDVTLRNPLGVRVAVALSVDGLNTIDARRTSAKDAAKWVIEPYGQITVRGWQMSQSQLRRFYFTSERESYANRLGRGENLGVISAVFFRERFDRPQPILPRSDRREPEPLERGRDKSSSSAGNLPRPSDRPMATDEYAGTGIGRSGNNDVWAVHMQLEPNPVASFDIRYEFRPALVRLGILPGYPYDRDPLDRREGASGFGQGTFCPEP